MIISKRFKKVILNLKNPERVTTLIPTAKPFEYKGQQLLAVPHKIDTVRTLRHLGHSVPSPIVTEYDWSGDNTPFNAQRQTADFLTMHPRAFVLSDMGTGKTLSTLWAFDYLRSLGIAKKLLVISPLSTLERTWGDEIFRHFPHLNFMVVHAADAKKRKARLATDADVYLINHDGVKTMRNDLIARTDIDTVVVDEIAAFRNGTSIRWKALYAVCAGRTRVWGLTGTPTPNEPTDAWAQCRIICPERVPKYFGAFRDATMVKESQFKWRPRQGATEIVAQAMQPSIRFARSDCIDLPECMTIYRHAEMSPEQEEAYNSMYKTLCMEFNNSQITASNEAIAMQKLVQIACGTPYSADGEVVQLPVGDRIDIVREVITGANAKVIVFVPFTSTLDYVADELRKHYTVEVINGSVPKSKRDDIFHRFQRTPDPKVLVAQPAAMSHGLTLTAADVIVWFAPITSQEIYTQANARITRPGQKNTQLLVNIEGSPIERKMYKRLETKQRMEGALLSEIREQARELDGVLGT